MAKIIDLSVLQREPMIFKLANNDEFTIPGEVNTEFVLKVYGIQSQLEKTKTDDINEQIKLLKEMVLLTLKLDTTKEVNMKYINENLNDVRYLKLIMEEIMKHINEVQSDPN